MQSSAQNVQFTGKEKEEKLQTEGDLVAPYTPKNLWNRAKETWNPWSYKKQMMCFYDPEDHVDLAKALQNAPIQSRENSEEKEEEKTLSLEWANKTISLK
jgi:hypothetical protein